MKLVEILAREMSEWPKGIEKLTQSCIDAEIYRTYGDTENDHEPLKNNFYVSERSDESHDYDYPIITREMWDAERSRIKGESKVKPKPNKDGWIRHRGGKCPVKDRSTYINGRFRSGEQYHGPAYGVAWSHVGKPSDIMAWRPRKPEQVTTEQSSDVEMPAAKYFDGPIQWRDRIREIDAASIALNEERASLVAKLKDEGFVLIQGDEPNSELESAQQGMSDPANWRVGDLFEIIGEDSHEFPMGELVKLIVFENDHKNSDGHRYAFLDNSDYWWVLDCNVRFHSRPTN